MSLKSICECIGFSGEHSFRERPSQYRAGDWVEVLGREAIEATLDSESKLRGLPFLPEQWAYVGGVYRVSQVVRRTVDQQGVFRPLAKTILLEGVVRSSTEHGPCPFLFRDEWVKPAAPYAASLRWVS
jgi:hypothetical protein